MADLVLPRVALLPHASDTTEGLLLNHRPSGLTHPAVELMVRLFNPLLRHRGLSVLIPLLQPPLSPSSSPKLDTTIPKPATLPSFP